MSIKEMLHKTMIDYFILVTFISAAIFVLGKLFDPSAQLTYDALMSPLLFAALGIIPDFIMFSKKELSVKQIIVRKTLQLLLIEAEVIAVCISSTAINTEQEGVTAGLVICVFIVFVIANAVSVLNDYFSAKRLTEELMLFKQNAE